MHATPHPTHPPTHPRHRHADRFTRDEIELRPEPSLEQFGVRLPRSSKDGNDHSARRLQEQAGATNGGGGGGSSSGTSMSGDSDASSMRSSGSSSSGTDDENCVWAAAVASDEECEAAVADGGGKDGSNGGTIAGRRSGGKGAGGTGNGAAATAQPIGNQLQQHKGKKKQELKHKQQLKMKEKMGPGSKVVARQQRGSAPQSKRCGCSGAAAVPCMAGSPTQQLRTVVCSMGSTAGQYVCPLHRLACQDKQGHRECGLDAELNS